MAYTSVDAQQFLYDANLPQTKPNILAVTAWLNQENGPAGNPLGANYTAAGGLPNYGTTSAGLAAAAKLFSTSSNYSAAYQKLVNSDALGFINEIAKSPWAAPTHYGWPATNNLLSTYNRLLGQPNQGITYPPNPSGPLSQEASKVNNPGTSTLGLNIGLPNIDVPGAMMFLAVVLVGIAFIIVGGLLGAGSVIKGKAI